MNNNTIKLILTVEGRKRIDVLIKKGSTVSLKVAIGDGTSVPTKDATTLSHERLRVQPSAVNDDKKGNWHINVNFSPDANTFDITELGLFVGEQGENTFTLLGIYHESTAFAKKMKNSDMLIDIVINIADLSGETIKLENYDPKFSIPHATSDTYGAVKFATQDDITKSTAGLALTTDNLHEIVSLLKTEAANVKLNVNVVSNSLKTEGVFAPMGFFVLQNVIYILMLASEEREGTNSIVVKYDVANDKLEESAVFKSDKIIYLPSPTYGVKNDKINWLVFKNREISRNDVWQLQASLDMENPLKLDSDRFNFSAKDESGSLLFYNESACIIGGFSKADKQLLVATDDYPADNKDYKLSYARRKPLIQLIQDKIYCLGGNVLGEPVVEIHSIQIDNKKIVGHVSFTPPNTAPVHLDLRDTTGWSSCVVRNCIYIFEVTTYHKASKAAIFYYYDYLANTWQTSTFSKDAFAQIDSVPTYGEAVSDGKVIYLFCTSDAGGRAKINIIKFIPG